MKIFPELWEKGNWEEIDCLIADKGYDAYEVKRLIREAGKHPVIPRRKGAVCPGVQDKERLALRFDKLDFTFFSFFAIACLKVFKLFC